ncbi:RIP metalloprotease RseP [Hydrogenovibrio sp. JE_KL2]|uniref:RIP metalloprotease RseP n=1 Tax=Hydrogenovibrio sp. JE_KL2 TaxID=2651188 RepID=UPI00128CE607|nr:RIP metalloprotease RseP [Hydrogenovibrio sp. JE_KL2]MPQ76067.1 RIP metalloprotease RseP [Hydrogenovibrio sp. JE_KL2]
MTFLWSALGFVIAMGLLVAIHEWGHFIVAKLFNVKVLTFSIGFGKPLLKKRIGETQYQLAMFPLGGYVKFLDERNSDAVSSDEDMTRAFNRQTVFKRFAIVLAGPLINLVFAWLVFSWLYFWGVPGMKPIFEKVVPNSALSSSFQSVSSNLWQIEAIDQKATKTWRAVHQQLLLERLSGKDSVAVTLRRFSEDTQTLPIQKNILLSINALDLNNPKQDWLAQLGFVPFSPSLPPVIGEVVPNSPAFSAGFLPGDRLEEFNGRKLSNWSEFATEVRANPGKEIGVVFLRNGNHHFISLRLGEQVVEGKSKGVFGAKLHIDETLFSPYQTMVSFPFFDAVQEGFTHSANLIEMTLDMIQKMFNREVSPRNLSGPISIADYSGKALENGWVSFLSLLGLLSLSLGILNLLPIPMLDGGHLVLYSIEAIKGVPISDGAELFVQKLGFMIIVSLTIFALINDLVRISND